jgi:hypothetical protein
VRIILLCKVLRVDAPPLPAGSEFDVVKGSCGAYINDKPGSCVILTDVGELVVFSPEFEVRGQESANRLLGAAHERQHLLEKDL